MGDFLKGVREVSRDLEHKRHLAGWQHKPCPNPNCGKGECRKGYVTPRWTDYHAYGEDTYEGEPCPTCRGAGRIKVQATKDQQKAAIKREIRRLKKHLKGIT